MDVESFVLALDEVGHDHGHGEVLGAGEGAGVGVDVGSDKDVEGVDQDGSEVFEDEDCDPGHLWACNYTR